MRKFDDSTKMRKFDDSTKMRKFDDSTIAANKVYKGVTVNNFC